MHRNFLAALTATALVSFIGSSASAVAGSGTWSATGTDANWSTPGNWTTAVPGAITGTTNADTATFNAASPNFGTATSPVVIDSGRNVKNITFDLTAAPYVIGATGGNALTLTSGGTIQNAATLTSSNVETINAPLVFAGVAGVGTYTIQNNSTALGSALQIGGPLNAAASTALTLTLGGTNTSTSNTVSGVIGAGTGAGTVALTKSGAGYWDITGNNTAYSGTTSILGGTLSMGNANALGSGLISIGNGTLAADQGVSITNNVAQNGVGQIVNVGGSNSIATSGNFSFLGTTGTPSDYFNNMTGGASFSTTGVTYLNSTNDNTVGEAILGGPGNTSLSDIWGNTGSLHKTVASLLYSYGTGTLTLNGKDFATGPLDFLGGTIVANENGSGAGALLGTGTNFLTLGSNLILSGSPGTAESVNGFAVQGSAQLSYQANISATPGNTISLGTIQDNSGASTANFQTGIASTTTPSGAAAAGNSGFTAIYGGWAVSGNGLNSEDFAVNLATTATSTPIIGLPTYLYSLNGQNTQYVKLVANDGGGAQSDSSGNFNSVKFDTSNSATAGTFTATKSNAFFDNDGGIANKSFNFLFTGFGNLTVNGDAIVQNFNTSANVNGILYLQQYASGVVTIASNIYGTGSFTGAGVGGGASPVNGNVANIIGGSSGTIVKSGPGTVVLTGTNNYVGNTFVNGGVLSISSDSNLGGINGLLTVTGGSGTTSVTVTGELAYQDLIGASFLGTTITNQSGSTGTVTLTLAANGNGATGSNPFANGQQLIELNGGTLQDTANVTLGETSGTVSNYRQIVLGVNGGTIDVTGTNTLIAPGIISQSTGGTGQLGGDTGVASLIKVDSGTLVLAGANTYLGGTYINGGTLKLDFSATGISNFTALSPTSNILAAGGAVSLGGGTLNITDSANAAAANSQTIASLALSGGSNTVSMTHTASGAASSVLAVTNGTINRTAGSTVDFILASSGATSIVLSGNNSNPFIGNYAFFGTGAAEGYAATSSTGAVQAAAATAAVSANNFNSATGNYSYNTSGATPDTLTTSATANTVINANTAAQTINLGANSLTLNGLINNNGALTISGTGSVIIGTSNELVVGGSTNVSISSAISGGALTDSNSGILALSGVNTYTGATTVNAGTLSITGGSLATSSITTVGSGVVNETGGVIGGGSGTTFNQASSGTSTLAGVNTFTGLTTVSNGELDLNAAGTGTNQALAGNLAVTGGTAKLLASNQINAGKNISVSGGTLNLQTFSQTVAGVQLTGGTLSGTTGVLTSNSAFDIQAGVDSAILAGTSGLTKSTTGVALITSTNTYTGTTAINGGTLYISSMGNLGASTGAVVLGGGSLYYTGAAVTDTRGFTLTANSEIDSSATGTGFTIGTNGITGSGFTTTFGGTGNTTVTSAITTGTGGLTNNAFGTVFLSGANTFTGVTTLNNGILNLASGLALGGAGNITFGSGTLQYSNLNAADVSGRIVNSTGTGVIIVDTNSQTVNFASALASSNVAGLSKVGLGDLILSGANAYTGATFLNAGLLTVNNSSALGSGTGNVTFLGGTLQYTSNNTTDYSSRIKSSTGAMSIDTNGQAVTFATALPSSNNAGLTKLGAGTLSLTAANLFTGTVVVGNGTLQVGNGTTGSLASNAVTFNSGTLNLNQAANTTQTLGALTFSTGDGVVQSTYAGSGTNTTSFASLSARPVGATGNFVLSGGTTANNIINVPTVGTAGGGELGVGYFFNGSSYAVNGAPLTVTNGVVNGPVRAINYGTDPGTITNGTSTASITNPNGSIAGATTTATSLTTATTNGSPVVTVATAGLAIGNPVSGTGIPAGALITAIGSGNVTISANATVTNNANSTVFGTSNIINTTTTGLVVGQYVSGTNIPANSYITAIGSGTITISQYATAAGTTALAYSTPFVQTTANVTAQASTSMTDLNLSGTPNYTLGTAGTASTVKLDGILKSGGGASTIASGGAAATNLTSLNSGDEFVIRTDTASDALTISANILANGTNALTKSGAGTLTLSGANTYTGVTTIDGGTLAASTLIGTSSNLGVAGGIVLNGGGIFSYTGSSASTTRNVAFSTAGGEIDTTTSGQTLSDSGTVTTLISSVGTFGGAGNTTLSGVVSGAGGITKTGTGTLTLSNAANTYLGPTSVNGGILSVTGNIASGSPVTVGGFSGGSSSAVLGGTGTISGTLTTASANGNVGHLAPGVNTTAANQGVAGTLTVAGSLTIGSGTNLDIDLSASTASGNDLITMNGTGAYGALSIGSALTFNINALGGAVLATSANSGATNFYTIIGGATSLTGTALTSVTPTFNITGSTDIGHLVTSGNGNNLEIYFTSSVTAATYTLTATPANARVMAGGSVAITSTLSNTGPTGADSVSASGIALTPSRGSVTPGTTTIGTTAVGANNSVTSGTLNVGGTTGVLTLTQSGTVTSPNSTPTGSITGTSVSVLANRVITVPSVSLGRYLVGSTVTKTSQLSSTTGDDNSATRLTLTGAAGTADANGIALVASGSALFNGSSATPANSLQTISGSTNSAHAGAVSGSINVPLTGENLAGETDQSVNITYTGNALNLRTITPGAVTNLGLLHAGATVGTTSNAFTTTTNDNASTTSVSVAAGSGTANGITFGGAATNFTGGATGTGSRTLSGTITQNTGNVTNGVVGSTTGTDSLAVTSLETGLGDTYGAVNVGYTAQVYSGTSTWAASAGGTWGSLASNFGTNWGANQGSPGLDSNFTHSDTATFGNSVTSGTAHVTLDVPASGANNPSLNSITFNDTNAGASYSIDQGTGSGSLLLNGTGNTGNLASVVNSSGANKITAPVVLSTSANVNVSAGSLEISGPISGSGTGLNNIGAGATILSNATGNTYSGPTTISAGKVYATNNTSGSATGTGPVNVTNTGVLNVVGSGANKGSVSGTINLSSGGTFYSGGVSSGNPITGAGTGATLSSALNVNGGNLTFALSAGGAAGVSNPNMTTSFITTTSTVNFTGADNITLVDLTNGALTLRQNASYLLINNMLGDAGYSNLVIVNNGVYTLNNSANGYVDGYVAGVYNGSGAASNLTPFSFTEFGADGVTPLANIDGNGKDVSYLSPTLYLYQGKLEVVPEPSTWALMIGGLALLIVIQRRRRNNS